MTTAAKSLGGKTVVVTGANAGIGKETAVALAAMGARVVMVARDEAKGRAALADVRARAKSDAVELYFADFASLASTRAFAAKLTAEHDRLDVLVNNAGLLLPSRSLTEDGFESMFGINHLGYFLTTHLLLPLLAKSGRARIVNVASAAHKGARLDFDDLQSEKSFSPFGAYGRSKLCNILFTYELAERLAGRGVTANCLHPGVVATDFGQKKPGLINFLVKLGKPFLLSADDGAATQVFLASSPEVEGVSSKYWDKKKPIASSVASRDVATRKRLWDVSEKLCGITRYGEP